jgi:hypothetical protein
MATVEHKPCVIGIFGKKQSGKNTSANYIAGGILAAHGIIGDWKIDGHGKIVAGIINGKTITPEPVDVIFYDNSPTVNTLLQDADVSPANLVHIIHFADALKVTVNEMFGIPLDILYGDNADKETITGYTAQSFNSVVPVPDIHKRPLTKSKLSVREVMQLVGDIGRTIDPDLFVNRLLEKIYLLVNEWRPKCIIVPDVRYRNECMGLKEIGATLIGLTRKSREGTTDKHSSESEDNLGLCDMVIENDRMTVIDQCMALAPIVQNILAAD